MDKYVAQLQQDTGATPNNIVEAAGGGGGSNLLVLETTCDSGTYEYSDVSKTSTEIAAAADDGSLPVVLAHNWGGYGNTLVYYYSGISGTNALFLPLSPGSTCSIDDSGHVTIE